MTSPSLLHKSSWLYHPHLTPHQNVPTGCAEGSIRFCGLRYSSKATPKPVPGWALPLRYNRGDRPASCNCSLWIIRLKREDGCRHVQLQEKVQLADVMPKQGQVQIQQNHTPGSDSPGSIIAIVCIKITLNFRCSFSS